MFDTSSERIALGKRIKLIRESRNLSQNQLGLMTGISRNYLVGIESGQYNVTIDKVIKIAKGLDISLEELFQDL